MAEEKKTPATKANPPSADKPATQPGTPAGALASAAASSDPAVHQLLAEMDIARSNGNDEGVQSATGRLRDLGYE